MTPKFHIPASILEIDTELPSVAIDLSGAYRDIAPEKTGYCQSAWIEVPEIARPCTQSDAASLLVDYLSGVRKAGATAINLVLEAPLSYAFGSENESGIALDARMRPVERARNYTGLPGGSTNRPWIKNAGAATSIVALLFLKTIRMRIPDGVTINLFEGFWSWIDADGGHHGVAIGLLAGLRDSSKNPGLVVPTFSSNSQNYSTALELIGDTSPTAALPPLIVFGHPDLARSFTHPAPLITAH